MTKALVILQAPAIRAVANRLKEVDSLDREQVAALIAANPPVAPAEPA